MEVVAAAVPVDVQHLAAGIKAGHQEAFHRLGVELICVNAASGDLGGIHAQGLGQTDAEVLDRPGNLVKFPVGQFRNGSAGADSGGLTEHPPQAVVENARQKFIGGEGGGSAAEQFLYQFRFFHAGEEVQNAFPVAASLAGIPGDFKDHRSTEAEVRKLNLSCGRPVQIAVVENCCVAVGPDALESGNASPGGLDLDQSRAELGTFVAKGPQELVARHGASQLGARQTAAGDDEPVKLQGFTAGGHEEFPVFFHLSDFKIRQNPNIFPSQRKTQNVHHGVCLVGVGVYPAALLGDGEQAQLTEPFQCGLRTKLMQRVFCEGCILAMIAALQRVAVAQVAPAIARGTELAAQPGLPFHQDDLYVLMFRGGQSRSDPRRAAADDSNGHFFTCFQPFIIPDIPLFHKQKLLSFPKHLWYNTPGDEMERSNIEKIAQNAEDRVLLAKVWDKINAGMRKNIPANSCFLSPRELELTRLLLGEPEGLYRFGGYGEAERQMLCYLPDYLDEGALMDADSPVVCLRAVFFEGDTLTHRDFLGALMGAGIARETLGDICVGKGSCDFFVTREIAPYLLQSFDSAGRTRFRLSQIPLEEASIPAPEVKEVRDTLASLRLDAVISAGFRVGRSLAADYVNAGKTAINGLPCLKPDKAVQEGDKVSVRGLGKIRLVQVNGQTKKGRISVVIHRYV